MQFECMCIVQNYSKFDIILNQNVPYPSSHNIVLLLCECEHT